MKLDIISISGGLGNQMFQYAFYLSIKYIYCKEDFNEIYISNYKKHNGYELDSVFGIRSNVTKNFLIGIIKKVVRVFGVTIRDPGSYTADIFKKDKYRPFVLFSGYWQNEKYFTAIRKKVTDIFNFNYKNLNNQSIALLNTIRNTNSVCIHIRRGDYENDAGIKAVHGAICEVSYYIKGVNCIQSIVEKPVYFIFSDDIEWAVRNFAFLDNPVFVDWNKKKDSWQDMFLMSECKHNIIANSSFSWWGAWLNSNPNKIVIAPQRWFNTSDFIDIVPERWIKL